DTVAIAQTLRWTQVPADIYVALLQMIVMPLVLVTMVNAMVRLHAGTALGKTGASIIGLLVFTTMIAALVGIAVTAAFGLSAEGLIDSALSNGSREVERAAQLVTRQQALREFDLPTMLVNLVPTNIFADLAGLRDTSVIAVV